MILLIPFGILTSLFLSLSDLSSFSLSTPFPLALISPSTLCCVRSLVDILRHQSSPVQQGERNNSTGLPTTTSDGRTSKNLYTPILQSKDNRSESHTHYLGWKHKTMLSYSGEIKFESNQVVMSPTTWMVIVLAFILISISVTHRTSCGIHLL